VGRGNAFLLLATTLARIPWAALAKVMPCASGSRSVLFGEILRPGSVTTFLLGGFEQDSIKFVHPETEILTELLPFTWSYIYHRSKLKSKRPQGDAK